MNIVQPADLSPHFFKVDNNTQEIKIKQLYTIAQLRVEITNPPLVFINDTIKGFFVLNSNDTITADDGVNVIINGSGKRYFKQLSNYIFFVGVGETLNMINNQETLTITSDIGIETSLNLNHELNIQNKISTLPNNRLTIAEDGGLYSEQNDVNIVDYVSSRSGNVIYVEDNKIYTTLPTNVISVGYDGSTGELITIYSDNVVVKSQIISVDSQFDEVRVSGTAGGNFNINRLNKNLIFTGEGVVPVTNPNNRSVNLLIASYSYQQQVASGNEVVFTLPLKDPYLGVYRNGILQIAGTDYTGDRIGNTLTLNFTVPFGSTPGGKTFGETIILVTLLSE